MADSTLSKAATHTATYISGLTTVTERERSILTGLSAQQSAPRERGSNITASTRSHTEEEKAEIQAKRVKQNERATARAQFLARTNGHPEKPAEGNKLGYLYPDMYDPQGNMYIKDFDGSLPIYDSSGTCVYKPEDGVDRAALAALAAQGEREGVGPAASAAPVRIDPPTES